MQEISVAHLRWDKPHVTQQGDETTTNRGVRPVWESDVLMYGGREYPMRDVLAYLKEKA